MTPLALVSPITGLPLVVDTPSTLTDGVTRWPVIDGIPYLRVGRDALAAEVVARLDGGDAEGALIALLADQDDWWDGPVPDVADLRELVRQRDRLTLRDAMAHLSFGRVGDYFAHRWSDPTYMAGLALVEAHWATPRTMFELACGIGHYLREFQRLGVDCVGADVVFSKLWLARHFVVGPRCNLICFDAGVRWPLGEATFDLVLCQDAFYFLEPKLMVLDALNRAARDGVLLVGHIHNSARLNASAGKGISVTEAHTFFPNALLYDDLELTRAVAEARAPTPANTADLETADAIAAALGPACPHTPRVIRGGFALPNEGARLRRNPLYVETNGSAAVNWPSERYRTEYAANVTYPHESQAPREAFAGAATLDAARRRELLDLPARW